ncbi:hypothetical protein [Asticcacaulis sp. EMRT-3]|uniref:hypothetical protein n=1 Tax=Asticcacaulis sp. EMRT-3 TaxID=3040349 RepID=UPI0024AF96F5|nr:hypothetical protein [Asticcacaulis sp. EMRT-3]MDI7774458.1 hypothetical protein [Asticcacaulis sp. EMRT-3]
MNNILIACGLLVGVMALSLYLSRPNWPYHPGGQKGYITDMLIYLLLPVAPVLICVGGFGLLTLYSAQFQTETARYVLLGIAFVGMMGARRLPFVAAAQNRVRIARNARFEAMRS